MLACKIMKNPSIPEMFSFATKTTKIVGIRISLRIDMDIILRTPLLVILANPVWDKPAPKTNIDKTKDSWPNIFMGEKITEGIVITGQSHFRSTAISVAITGGFNKDVSLNFSPFFLNITKGVTVHISTLNPNR